MLMTGTHAGCAAVYSAIKYLAISSRPRDKFWMKYDDYYLNGKQMVKNELKSFCDSPVKPNCINACLLEIQFRGFERKFPSSDHMLSIIKLNNKFRIVQSFEKGFSLKQELNRRDWIDIDTMKDLADCLVNVVLDEDPQRAMAGFKKLFGITLKTDKKRFKKRNTTGSFGIYVARDMDIKRFIKTGNTLISDISKHI